MTSVVLQAIHTKRQCWMAVMASGAKIRTTGFAALPLLQDLVEFRTIENRAMFFWVFTRAVHMAVIALTCDASFGAECFPVRVNRAANLSAFRCKNKLSLFLKKSIFFDFFKFS